MDIQAAQDGRSAASSVKLAEGCTCSLMGCQERAARAPGAATRSRSRLAETCTDRLLDEWLVYSHSPDHHNGAGVLHIRTGLTRHDTRARPAHWHASSSTPSERKVEALYLEGPSSGFLATQLHSGWRGMHRYSTNTQ